MKYKTKVSIFGDTNMGRVRTNNEDAYVAQTLWDENTYLAIAIDGVGGYEGGEIAAAIAKKNIPEYLLESSNGERVELLKQAVTAANNAIFDAREKEPEYGQMSCVLTAAIIDLVQKQISMVHVGDSRLYAFHHGELKKLSHDHSLVGFREENGDLTEEEAMRHPQRNVIGRDVGSQMHKASDEDFIEAEVFPLLPNTTLLFCSDGLTDMITSSTITMILNRQEDLKNKAHVLINAALEAGGKDNVTVVLFEYKSDEPDMVTEEKTIAETPEDNAKHNPVDVQTQMTGKPSERNWLKMVLGVIAGLLIGFVVSYACFHKGNMENGVEKIGGMNDSTERKNPVIIDFDTQQSSIESGLSIDQSINNALDGQLNQADQTIDSMAERIRRLERECDTLRLERYRLLKEVNALKDNTKMKTFDMDR